MLRWMTSNIRALRPSCGIQRIRAKAHKIMVLFRLARCSHHPFDKIIQSAGGFVKPFVFRGSRAVYGPWPSTAYQPAHISASLPVRRGSKPGGLFQYRRTSSEGPPRKPSGHYAGPHSELTAAQRRRASRPSILLVCCGASGGLLPEKPSLSRRLPEGRLAAAPASRLAFASRSSAPSPRSWVSAAPASVPARHRCAARCAAAPAAQAGFQRSRGRAPARPLFLSGIQSSRQTLAIRATNSPTRGRPTLAEYVQPKIRRCASGFPCCHARSIACRIHRSICVGLALKASASAGYNSPVICWPGSRAQRAAASRRY